MTAFNIIWDCDSEEEKTFLPTEIEIPEELTDGDGFYEEEISDYISAFTGFCHKGFELKD